MVSQIQSGILIASYTYDSQNRMTAAATYGISRTLTETYNYDALGNRIAKTTDGVKTEYLIDYSAGYAQVLRATTADSSVFYTRGFELISRKDATRELWYLTDGGGSVRCLTDSTGSVTDSLVFDAFGNSVSRAGQTGDSYGFQGEQQDATGLYYLRARYMNPATGSFTQMDTYGGSLSDPMSLHKYLFANANPVKYRDPSGHAATLLETELSIAIFSVLSAGYETNIYVDNFFDQVQPGEQYDYGEYLAGAGKTFMHGFAFGLVSMVCVLLVSICAFTLLECVLCALILLCAGLLADFEAARLDSQGNSQGAEVADYISQLCYTGSLTFVFSAGSAGGVAAGGGTSTAEGVAAEGMGESVTISNGLPGGTQPMTEVRIISKGEKVVDLVDEIKQLTFETGNEHAVVKLTNGERAIISGGTNGISFSTDQVSLVFGHSHPYQLIASGPSIQDIKALDILGQRSSYLLEHGSLIKFTVS